MIKLYDLFYSNTSGMFNVLATSESQIDEIAKNMQSIFHGWIPYNQQLAQITAYPFMVSNYDDIDDSQYNLGVFVDQEVVFSAIKVVPSSQLKNKFFLGEYYVSPKYYNFLDYKGYTYVECFIPYVGWVDIDVNECMGKWLQFAMLIDYFTGNAIFAICVKDNSTNTLDYDAKVIAYYEARVGVDIPIGSTNAGDIQRNVAMGAVKIVATAVAAYFGGPSAAATTSSVVTTTEPKTIKARGTEKGSRLKTVYSESGGTTTVTSKTETVSKTDRTPAFIRSATDSAVDALNRSYPSSRSDRVNTPSCMQMFTDKIIIKIYRPSIGLLNSGNTIEIDDIGHLIGMPLGEVRTLGLLRNKGFTSVSDVKIEPNNNDTIKKLYAQMTTEEIARLNNELKAGVYL